MTDLVKDTNYLRFHYTSEESLKDKDVQKNLAY